MPWIRMIAGKRPGAAGRPRWPRTVAPRLRNSTVSPPRMPQLMRKSFPRAQRADSDLDSLATPGAWAPTEGAEFRLHWKAYAARTRQSRPCGAIDAARERSPGLRREHSSARPRRPPVRPAVARGHAVSGRADAAADAGRRAPPEPRRQAAVLPLLRAQHAHARVVRDGGDAARRTGHGHG